MTKENNVVSFNDGGNTDLTPGKVSDAAVGALEEALEQARSGEIVGVTIIKRHQDCLGSYHIAGIIGGYSMLGGAQCAVADLLDVARGTD